MSLSVCVYRWISLTANMVLLYNLFSQRSWGRVPPPRKEKSPLEKIPSPLKSFFLFFKNLRLHFFKNYKGGGVVFYHSPHMYLCPYKVLIGEGQID